MRLSATAELCMCWDHCCKLPVLRWLLSRGCLAPDGLHKQEAAEEFDEARFRDVKEALPSVRRVPSGGGGGTQVL